MVYFGALGSGTYEIRETATLPGYNLDPTVTKFTVDANGMINGKTELSIERKNTPNQVELHKYDIVKGINSGELKGAHLQITHAGGK